MLIIWPFEHSELCRPGIEHELLCEIDTTSIRNKFAMAKSRNAILTSRFAAFDNRPRHL